jgi:hypothetical protein
MMKDHVTIWDGIEFLHIPDSEARNLEKADKIQICEPFLAATELKFREEFSGYDKAPFNSKEPKKKNAGSKKKKA